MLETIMEGYELAFGEDSENADFQRHRPESVRVAMRRSMSRCWKHLARERIKDVTPTIPMGKRFWPLQKDEKVEMGSIFQREDGRRLVISVSSRDDKAAIKVLDAAYWMKGCSSLGRLRVAVLLGIGESPYKGESLCHRHQGSH